MISQIRTRDYKLRLSEVTDEMTKILTRAELQKRGLTPEEDKRFKELETRAEELKTIIDYGERLIGRAIANIQAGDAVGIVPSFTRLDADFEGFSLLRLLRGMVAAKEGRANPFAECEQEIETSKAIARAVGREPRGFYVPVDALRIETRDLVKGTPTAGGHLVATDLLAGNFIDLLRNRMAVVQAGATVLGGLQGDIDIPRQTSSATAYWVAEGGAPTESQPAFDKVSLSPKTVGAFTDISRKMLLQSSVDVEALVRRDLANVLSLAIDRAALHGSGQNNQPTGIASISGVNVVVGGDNGAAPTWEHIVKLQTEVAIDNADTGRLAYITNAKVAGKLKTTLRTPTYGEVMVWEEPNRLAGYPAFVSNQVRSDLTKGSANNCSAIFFGNWSDLLIGVWGVLDILVDPYTLGTSGGVRIIAFQDVDIAVRHPESFAVMLDALTS